MSQFFVYILANRPNGAIYIGITSDLKRRVFEHKSGNASVFTKRYGINRLVYFEQFANPKKAIQRETNLKFWRRAWKNNLIEAQNPDWCELNPGLAATSSRYCGQATE